MYYDSFFLVYAAEQGKKTPCGNEIHTAVLYSLDKSFHRVLNALDEVGII